MITPPDNKQGIYLCKVRGLKFCDYMVLRWSHDEWMQYNKDCQRPIYEGWFGLDKDIEIIDAKLIEEDEE